MVKKDRDVIILFMDKTKLVISENVDIKPYVSFGIGGTVKYFIEVRNAEEIMSAVHLSEDLKVPFAILGGGKNVVFSDGCWDGLVIRIADGIIKKEGNKIVCDAGACLSGLVSVAAKNGLYGLESLAGIPGTVGGAIYGNAGAYSHSISDFLQVVTVFNGKKIINLKKDECKFSYRDSLFKKKKWIILSAEFELKKGGSVELEKTIKDIIAKRWNKFGENPRCPGSYFKNVLASDLSHDILKNIDETKIIEGKIPSGYLLESVGAKGMRVGDIYVSDFHGNIILNGGNGTHSDLLKLTKKLKKLVKEKYGIVLKEEVVFLTK